MKQIAAKPSTAIPTLPFWLRLLFRLFLLSVAAVCAVGFLGTLEPNHWWIIWPWRVAYAVLGVGSLAGAVELSSKRGRKNL